MDKLTELLNLMEAAQELWKEVELNNSEALDYFQHTPDFAAYIKSYQEILDLEKNF